MTSASNKPATNRRRWLAISLATLIMLFSYAMFIFAFAVGSGDETVFAGGILGIALGLVPGVFITAAFVSQNQRTARATVAAMGLWIVVTAPIALVDLPTGLVAGFGSGGIVAFRLGKVHTWQSRAVAVAACVAYAFVLQRVSLAAGLLGAAPLPFVAIGIADIVTERAAKAAEELGDTI